MKFHLPKTRPFPFLALVLLATVPCCNGATRFVYAVTGRPAAGVKVQLSTGRGVQEETTDSRGWIRGTVGPGRVDVIHSASGRLLLSQGFDTPQTEVVVGLPVRISGSVSGFGDDPAQIQIDAGFGPRVTVSDYERTVQGLRVVEQPNENVVHGLDLPTIPQESVRVQPDASGNFITPWLAALRPVEMLVFNQAGRMGLRTVAFPSKVRAGDTVPAGRIEATVGATLQVRLNVPKTDLPLGLLASVEALEPEKGTEHRTAEFLSALHRCDAATAQWLTQRREWPLEFEGTTSIAGLPPLRTLRLVFTGPVGGIHAERDVTVPASGVVDITLNADELLGRRDPRFTLTGVLRYENEGAPVGNATVVYSSYPDRYETKSGADGRFSIPGVVQGRSGMLFVEAPIAGAQPPFDRITVTRPVPVLTAAGANAEQVIEIPRPPPNATPMSLTLPSGEQGARENAGVEQLGEFKPIDWIFPKCGTTYTQDELEYVSQPILTIYEEVNKQLQGPIRVEGKIEWDAKNAFAVANVIFPKPGLYVAFLQYTPFVYDAKPVWIVDSPGATITFQPARNFTHVLLVVFANGGQPAPAGVELFFPGWSPEPSPYSADTDENGRVMLTCVSRWPYPDNYPFNFLEIFVDDPVSGYFAGVVPLPPKGDTALLDVKLGPRQNLARAKARR